MIHAREDYNRIQDPLNKIGDDEPVFLLRAQDISAPDTLRVWARINIEHNGDKKLSDLANKHADLMETWQSHNTRKPADS